MYIKIKIFNLRDQIKEKRYKLTKTDRKQKNVTLNVSVSSLKETESE